jgi:hypothetical protein
VRLVVAIVLAACAPTVDGPVERQRAGDRADALRLSAQLDALPGVVRSEIVLRRPAADPLAIQPAATSTASLVIIIDDRADKTAIANTARALFAAIAPGLEPTIVVEVGAVRPTLAKVGPFTVEARSKGPLRAVLAGALGIIAVLAAWLAWRYRRGSRAQ